MPDALMDCINNLAACGSLFALFITVVCHSPICDPSTWTVTVNDHPDPLGNSPIENSIALIHGVPHDGSRLLISTPKSNIFALKLPCQKAGSIISIQNCHRFGHQS